MKSVNCGVSGLAQRVIKQLRNRPLLNSELAILLNLDERDLFKSAKVFLRNVCSYEISASAIFINERGNKDRQYNLVRYEPEKAKVIASFNKRGTTASRKIANAMAKERGKLIASGRYNDEVENKLCEKYY